MSKTINKHFNKYLARRSSNTYEFGNRKLQNSTNPCFYLIFDISPFTKGIAKLL